MLTVKFINIKIILLQPYNIFVNVDYYVDDQYPSAMDIFVNVDLVLIH